MNKLAPQLGSSTGTSGAIVVLSTIGSLVMDGFLTFLPEHLHFEIGAGIITIAAVIFMSKPSIISSFAFLTPIAILLGLKYGLENHPEATKWVGVTTLSVLSLLLVFMLVGATRTRSVITAALLVCAIAICIAGMIMLIMATTPDSASSPGPTGTGAVSDGIDVSKRQRCDSKCGSDPVCFSACLDACKYSYCIEYGKRTPLTSSNCAEHQRKLDAAGIATTPGAILCREMHKHHGKCVSCNEPTSACVLERDCKSSRVEHLRSMLVKNKSNPTTNWYKTDQELQQQWSRSRI